MKEKKNNLEQFINALKEIDNDIYFTIKEKIINNKPLTRVEMEYLIFYINRIKRNQK